MAAGEFATADRYEIDKAIRAAEQTCRFEFSVFVGRSQGLPRDFATRLHSAAVAPARSVLILVDPDHRAIEVVTGDAVRRSLSDREVEHAVIQMGSAFAEGDLVDGLKRGIGQLAEHARAPGPEPARD